MEIIKNDYQFGDELYMKKPADLCNLVSDCLTGESGMLLEKVYFCNIGHCKLDSVLLI